MDYGYVEDLDNMELCFGGQYGINFDVSTANFPFPLTQDAPGSAASETIMAILNVYNVDNVEGMYTGKTVKQELIIPQYELTYERYATVSLQTWAPTYTSWKKHITREELPNNGMPVGSIIWHAAVTPPSGYLVCDGSAISKTTYAELYSVIGTNWGEAPDNCFLLPDLRDEFIRGYNPTTAATRSFGSK